MADLDLNAPGSNNPTDPDGRLTHDNGDHAGPDGWYVDEDSMHTRRARLIAKLAPKHTYIVSTDPDGNETYRPWDR